MPGKGGEAVSHHNLLGVAVSCSVDVCVVEICPMHNKTKRPTHTGTRHIKRGYPGVCLASVPSASWVPS